jgi:hypothetical protein
MRIGYDEECGSVVIVGGGVFPACTLRAVMQADGKVRVHSLAELAELYCDWFRLEDLNGRSFSTPEEAKAYLDGVLARRPNPIIPSAEGVAAEDIFAGMPVAVSRSDGALLPARADTYAQAFVIGLALADIDAGFAGATTREALTLPDWSRVAGTPALAVGQPYFLAAEGGLTLRAVDMQGYCAVRVGNATAPQTFTPAQFDPILL